ncbi:hypothetical protein HWV62_3100 [Athelia sp. TMB]|nr:hypothetical protein HWV62_3100 [Athelia sp. TMB]
MSSNGPVIIYGYEESPYAHKINHVLKLKNIPHHKVTVSSVLPRPELSELLGISYRCIPVLAIGNDVYCDTSLIAYALERRFPASAGHGSIFPKRKGGKADTGMIKAFQTYTDKMVFSLAAGQLPWNKFPEAFLKDRSEYAGGTINAGAMMARQPQALSLLSSNLALVEEQLSDGREWLFDTEQPSLADVSVYFPYDWIKWKKDLFDTSKFPHAIQWIGRMAAHLNKLKEDGAGKATDISGADAGKLILAAAHEPYAVVGFDEVEAKRLSVQAGAIVAIAPEDSGRKHPTTGKLVGLNREEFVLETSGVSGSLVRCHFPRIGYSIRAVTVGVGAKL